MQSMGGALARMMQDWHVVPGETHEPEPVCPRCDGGGWLAKRDATGRQTGLVECPVCKAVQKRRMASLRDLSTLTGELLDYRFDQFQVTPRTQAMFDKAVEFAENPQGWLVMTGTVGIGKTMLAACIANALVERGEPVCFVSAPWLLQWLRSGYGLNDREEVTRRNSQWESIVKADVLVLDDLGAEKETEWTTERIFMLLDSRMTAWLPTVITSNRGVKDFTARIGSRLADKRMVVTSKVEAEDWRRKEG